MLDIIKKAADKFNLNIETEYDAVFGDICIIRSKLSFPLYVDYFSIIVPDNTQLKTFCKDLTDECTCFSTNPDYLNGFIEAITNECVFITPSMIEDSYIHYLDIIEQFRDYLLEIAE